MELTGPGPAHAARLARLKAHGSPTTRLARIHDPVGLAIGAKRLAEAAVSILAQMTERLRTRS
ncbi:MAG: XdhC family protein [Rhizomicrobium sp.]|jgi:xanthine dehydrogenase accessory factor